MSFVIAEISGRQQQLEEIRRLLYNYQTACQSFNHITQWAREAMLVDGRVSSQASLSNGVGSQNVIAAKVQTCEEKSAAAFFNYQQAVTAFTRKGGSVQTLAQALYPDDSYQRYLFVQRHSSRS
ncbi:MAG: hypothetical protein JSS62_06435 [Verrucomicrobia bacterium]|nr:hypothetical protein [Verrucomicrobiota bacterium]MBS0646325.1 hypothetical protein [Verrucomicrobiota bacterium]